MQTIKIKLNSVTDKQIDLIVDYLKQGKVIAYPTDTVYGLGCIATDSRAINRVKRIKKQSQDKPLLVLMGDYKMLARYCFVNAEQKIYLKEIWPGPITVILKLKKKMPVELTGGLKTLAIRLPKSEFLLKIIKLADQPVVSTSLNLVGQPLLTSVKGIARYFKKVKPDLVIDAGVIKGKPSRLIDLTDINNVKILRK